MKQADIIVNIAVAAHITFCRNRAEVFTPVLVSGLIVPAMPYFLSFAAGAMIYVVVEELIPEMSQGEHSNTGVVMFALGFTVMMALDVALG